MNTFIKKGVSAFAALVLLTSVAVQSAPAMALGTKGDGDLDGDGKVTVSDARTALRAASGIISLTSAQQLSAEMDGVSGITVNDVRLILQKAVDLPPNPEQGLSQLTQLTPYAKSGSSLKAKYCVVTADPAETLADDGSDDVSDPLYSALPKGTFDQIKSGPITDSSSGNSYYLLASSRRVYTDDVKVISSGYVLPNNTASLANQIDYSGTSTKFYIGLTWRVPFNVQLKPQSYVSGYDGRVFNIASDDYTAAYMDIVFYNTTKVQGSLSFAESNTIKSTKWYVDTSDNTTTLRIYLRKTGGFYGYTAYYDSNNYLVISVKEPLTTLKGRTIEIDPGHGGVQPGAGSGTGVYERDLTYPIALQLKKLLTSAGATVIFSRDNSASVPEIEERRLTAIKKDPDLFVSIHLDANDSKSVSGSSVYYYKNYSGPLAIAIADALPSAYSKYDGYGMKNRGSHYYPFLVTRIENCPAVLVECGFITNTVSHSYSTSSSGTCPYTEPSSTLSTSSSGSGVKWLQWYLCKLGYLSSSSISGTFDAATLSAVKAFQKAKSLDVDGLVGPATRTALKSAYPAGSGTSSSGTGCDFNVLNSSAGQVAAARGIYNGILNYFSNI